MDKHEQHSDGHGRHVGGMSRRGFMAGAAGGLLGGLLAVRGIDAETVPAAVEVPATPASQVALCQGPSRGDNIVEILKRIEPQIRAGIAKKKRVIIKPNLVVVDRQLSATHAECLEGLLEFLTPMVEDDILIAETPANGTAAEGYSNYGMLRLQEKYRVKFLNLDEQAACTEYVVNERYHAVPVRYSKFLLDPDAFVISTAPLKTHDRAIVTLGIKNLAVGGILKDVGYRWDGNSRGTSDKGRVHGGPKNQAIHYNLFTLSRRLHPDLTVLDGFEGSEHNGPIQGTPVDHRVAVASMDWVAADRVAAELMGFDHTKIGYLVFCAQAGLGQVDLKNIELLGPAIPEIARPYLPHDSVEEQYKWM